MSQSLPPRESEAAVVDLEGLPAAAWYLAGAQEGTGFPLGFSGYRALNQLLRTNRDD